MSFVALLLPIMVLLGGGGGKGKPSPEAKVMEKAKAPVDVGAILRLQSRSFMAHACPIGPDYALTAAHVVDAREQIEREQDNGKLMNGKKVDWAATPSRYESVDGRSRGQLTDLQEIFFDRDLAEVKGAFEGFYRVAATCPSQGDEVTFMGYQLDKGGAFTYPQIFNAHVLSSVAGEVEYDKAGHGGSSGSCVLNAQNEVVAINVGQWAEGHGVGVLVCGEWNPGF